MARTLTRPALYEADHVAWLEEQAALLRAQRFDELDADNIAEELEGTARSDRRELFNRLAVLLRHLLKRQHQASRRTWSWDLTIAEQRSRLRRLLKESPSLRHGLEGVVEEAYDEAVRLAAIETGLAPRTFPQQVPYTTEEIVGSDRNQVES